jgi:hypothetical protein
METILQESGGLRRTAPVQSPVPVARRLSTLQRAVVCLFLATMALAYLALLLPPVPLSAAADGPRTSGH